MSQKRLFCIDLRGRAIDLVVGVATLESERRERETQRVRIEKKKGKEKRSESRYSATFSLRRLKPGLESIVQSKRGQVLRSKSSRRIVLGSTSNEHFGPSTRYLDLPFDGLVRVGKTAADFSR